MSFVTMGTYAILLFAMLAGLLRHQRHSRVFGVWPLLLQQVCCSLTAGLLELANMPNCLGMDLVCTGSGSRGAHSGACCLVESFS